MASDGLTGSPFDDAVMPAPSPDEATTAATKGGYDMSPSIGPGSAQGLVGTPFEKPIMTALDGGAKETPNMSALPLEVTETAVKEGPRAGTQIGVDPGVASPAVAVTPIVK